MIETNLQTHALTQPGLSANGSKDVSWKDGQFLVWHSSPVPIVDSFGETFVSVYEVIQVNEVK